MNSSMADIGIFHTFPIRKALIFLLFNNLYAVLRPINKILHISSIVNQKKPERDGVKAG